MLTQTVPTLPKPVRRSRAVYRISPLEDLRWPSFLQWHPGASVFQTTQWLEALRRTYGYEPIAYTRSRPSEDLQSGIVFCGVKSRLTGKRLVSLPFSDHCDPLTSDPEDLDEFASTLKEKLQKETWRYVELRPVEPVTLATLPCARSIIYTLHRVDLEPDLDTIFSRFHRSSTQRKIHRAAREGLSYQEGATEALLASFYRLLVLTRRRHGLPPQPKNLVPQSDGLLWGRSQDSNGADG